MAVFKSPTALSESATGGKSLSPCPPHELKGEPIQDSNSEFCSYKNVTWKRWFSKVFVMLARGPADSNGQLLTHLSLAFRVLRCLCCRPLGACGLSFVGSERVTRGGGGKQALLVSLNMLC